MPVYAYKCRDCGTPLEAHQEFSDAALTECPTCGGVLRKQYGTIGVTFNGSGFYRTDSRAGGSEGGTSESKSDSAKSESKSDSGTKSDAAKPTKTESAPKPASTSSSAPTAS